MVASPTTTKWRYILYVILAICYVTLGYFTQRNNFNQLIFLYVILFTAYVFIFRYVNTATLIREVLIVSVILRILLICSVPNLSDDVYRFIWDGRLTLNGINPYGSTPAQIFALQSHGVLNDFSESLLHQLNSQQYFSIYPPVCQSIFALCGYISHNNIYVNIVLLKMCMVFFEVGSIYFLSKIITHLHAPSKNIILYALNPLIILELTGNIHFEAGMIFFLSAAFYFLLTQRHALSAIFFGLAVATKLLPLIFLPFFIKYIKLNKALLYFTIAGIVSLILLLPMAYSFQNIYSSLDLYFQKFEYNASIYYVLKWIINPDKNYSTFLLLQKLLPLITFISIMCMSIWYNKKYFLNALQYAIFIYFIFSTTIHPWYISIVIMFSVFTQLYFPIVWSLFIYLTYSTYTSAQYNQNYTYIIIEYALVLLAVVYDIQQKKYISRQHESAA